MRDQPKPTGEWTVERVAWFIQEYGVAWQIKIVEAIKAELDAERLKSRDAGFMNAANVKDRVIKQLRELLAMNDQL